MAPRKGRKGRRKKRKQRVNDDEIVSGTDLTRRQYREFQRIFKKLDRDKDGLLTPAQVVTGIRGLGWTPTQADVEQLKQDLEEPGLVTFEAFCREVRLFMTDPKQQERDLREAFAVWDADDSGSAISNEYEFNRNCKLDLIRYYERTQKRRIDAGELERSLTTLGEPLTEREADELTAEATPSDNNIINYRVLANRLTHSYR